MTYPKLLLTVLLIVVAAFVRLIPHVPNATPLAAVALFGGANLPAPWSFVVPLAAMVASDAVIGFDNVPTTVAIYASFLIMVLFGWWLRENRGPWRVLGVTLASSVLFYLVTNAAVWKFSGMYAQNLDGLMLSYLYAIPFFRHTIMGDMAYTFSLFLAAEYVPALALKLRQVVGKRYDALRQPIS
jgi:hypothetical protein